MSSQVNKSNVKFKPKVKQRVRRNSTARRSSATINTTFSTPGDREALKARAGITESAIEEDEEFKVPSARDEGSMPPPQVKQELITRDEPERIAKAEVEAEVQAPVQAEVEVRAPVQAEVEVRAPVQVQVEMRAPVQVQAEAQAQTPAPAQAEAPVQTPAPTEATVQPQTPAQTAPNATPIPAPVQPTTPLSAPPSPKSLPQIIKGAIPQPVQPLAQALVPAAAEPEPEPEPQPEPEPELEPEQQLVVPDPQALAEDQELSDIEREPIYDKDGREILEPRDLRRMGKYNAKIHYHNKVINADTFTMATLCGDVPIGEVNEDYYKYEEVRSSRKRNRAQLLQAKRMIRGHYTPATERKRMQLLRVYKDWQDEREVKFGTKRPGVDIDSLEGPAGGTVVQQQPQLKRDAEGRIVVDSQSLVLDRHANNRADDENQPRIEAKKFGDHINSYSFSTKERPERWTSVETQTFYNAVSVWGTDFNLISQFFPQRTRGQIKTKFKYEERRNPDKLQLYLVHRKKVKLEDVARISGTTIVPAAEIEADLEQVRREHEEQMRKETEAREAAAKEDAQRKTMDHMRRRQAKGISGSSEVVGELPVKDELED